MLAEKFNVNTAGLENLLEGIVAYVEVRNESEDISNVITRELKEVGATVSTKRNAEITHVFFRNGTLRTSNWAKSRDIPLVDTAWLAACIRHRLQLHSRPWHVSYLKQPVDIFGEKKKMRYKKYFKVMNVEECKAEFEQTQEKQRKRFLKSVNKSKTDVSFNSDSYDEDRRMDPYHNRPHPVHEIAKRFQARVDKYKQTGRYSWESDEENKKDLNDDVKENKKVNVVEEELSNKDENRTEDLNKENETSVSNAPTASRKVLKSRRLFRESSDTPDKLIEPMHNIDSAPDLLPKVVQKAMEVPNKKSKKRQSWNASKEDDANKSSSSITSIINCSTDISLPKKAKVVESVKESKHVSLFDSFKTPSPVKVKTNESPSKIPVSPLVTNLASPLAAFKTPKNRKRLSLRTRLLKNSAKKKWRESQTEQKLDISTESTILVPETVDINRNRFVMENPEKYDTIMETPLAPNLSNQNPPNGNSLTESLIEEIIDSPNNVSRFLDKMIPDRQRPPNYDHILFIPKDSYDHCQKALPPSFNEQKNHLEGILTQSIADNADNIFCPSDNNDTTNVSKRKNVRKSESLVSKRKSARLSNRLSTDHLPLLNNSSIASENKTPSPINCEEAELIFRDDATSSNVLCQSAVPSSYNNSSSEILSPQLSTNIRYNTRKSISMSSATVAQPQPDSEKKSLKRPWFQIEMEKSPVKSKPPKSTKRIKKVRDSIDDFIMSPHLRAKNKKSSSTANTELILVGFTNDEENNIKSMIARLPNVYHIEKIIRSKEQIVIIPDKPKRTVDLVKAFVFGNTFLSVKWIYQSSKSAKWLDTNSFTIKDGQMIDLPIVPSAENSSIFNEYSPMYISTVTNGLQKYKLRILIEMGGGKVTDSFRQAGIVINTRKVNALSVKESWIIDSIKEGKVLNPKNYLIL